MDQILPPIQYIWRDYSLPSYNGVVMTLSNKWSFIGFTLFTSLLAFTHTRAWIILKSIGLRKLSPVRLPLDPNDPNYRLSQVGALRAFFFQDNRQNNQSMSTLPKELGVLAVFNVVIFCICAVVIPLYLTGNLSTSVVLSKSMDTCIGHEDRPQRSRYTAQLADSYFKKCLLNPAGDSSSCSKESGIVGSIPQLRSGRDETCPFPGDVCQDGVQPVRVEYMGFSPRDYGVNLGSQVLVDHRVVCAPLITERFLLFGHLLNNDTGAWENTTAIWFGRKFHDPTFNGTSSGLDGTFLATVNGPNSYSGEHSGNYLASYPRAQPAYDLNVYAFGPQSNQSQNVHPSLRRDDGQVFIVMLRAGRSLYQAPIDDPLYAAHNKYDAIDFYVPDYEATALGCVEQYRLRWNAETSFCTNWGMPVDVIMQSVTSVVANKNTNKEMLLDLAFVYPFFTTMASVVRYLQLRAGTQVLITSLLREGDIVALIDQKEQWVLEIKACFITAFLNARYTLLQIVRRNGLKRTTAVPEPMLKLCYSILFQNNDYTNVDLIGLLATISVLLLICVVSWGSTLAQACCNVWKVLNPCVRKLRRRVRVIYRVCRFREFLPFLVGYLPKSPPFRPQSQTRFPWNVFWNGGRRRQGDQEFSGNYSIGLPNR